MINLLRQNQRWLMILIVILTIISFVWLYNRTDFKTLQDTRIADIYGRTIHKVDIERQLKVYELSAILGQMDFLRDLGGSAQTPESARSQFIWNLMVLQHEADRLGIHPTNEQIVAGIRAIPALQKDGIFDPARYRLLLENVLAPRGMAERHLEDLIRDTIRLTRIREIVASPVAVSDGEVADAFRGFQAVDAQYVKLELAAAGAGEAVTDADVEKIFNEHKESFATPEYRSIQYIRLALPEGDAKLEGKARVDALQVLADQATQFVGQILEGGQPFDKAAVGLSSPVIQTSFFDRSGNPSPEVATVPAHLPPTVVQSAFSLTTDKPLSEIVQDGNAFYISTLQEVLPPRLLTLAEARPEIETQLRAQKAQAAFTAYSEAKEKALTESIKSGKSFAAAAKEAGLTAQTLLSYVPFQQTPSPEPDADTLIARGTLTLEPDEVSSFLPAAWGGFIVQLTKRAPIAPELFAQQKGVAKSQILDRKQNLLFIEWMRSALKEANLVILVDQK